MVVKVPSYFWNVPVRALVYRGNWGMDDGYEVSVRWHKDERLVNFTGMWEHTRWSSR